MFARLLTASRAASRVAAPRAAAPVRRMGGHGHGEKPKYEGFELTFRTYLPENHHVVYFLLGLYAGIGVLASLNSSSNKSAAVAALPPPSKPDYSSPVAKSSAIPTMVDNPKEWEAFVSQPGGFERWALGDAAAAPAAH